MSGLFSAFSKQPAAGPGAAEGNEKKGFAASISRPRWELAFSDDHDRYYYQDKVGGKSSWSKPPGCDLDADEMTRQYRDRKAKLDKLELAKLRKEKDRSVQRLPEGWKSFIDRDTQKPYYYNLFSGERTWFKPSHSAFDKPGEDFHYETHLQRYDSDGVGDETYDQYRAHIAKGFGEADELLRRVAKVNLTRSIWDPEAWLVRLKGMKDRGPLYVSKVRKEVKESNEEYLEGMGVHVPHTEIVGFDATVQALEAEWVTGYHMEPIVTISHMTPTDALSFFAKDRRRTVVLVNSAHGLFDTEVAAAYLSGIDEVEEEDELCSRCPNFYPSLRRANEDGLYPFGPPATQEAGKKVEYTVEKESGEVHVKKYSDVLYTPPVEKDHEKELKGVELFRRGPEHGYDFFTESEGGKYFAVVSAVPPRHKKDNKLLSDVYDSKQISDTITQMFAVPVIKDPGVTTIIIGAWGLEKSFNNTPESIARLFAEALTTGRQTARGGKSRVLGELYHEIHFALGSLKDGEKIFQTFVKIFNYYNVDFQPLDKHIASHMNAEKEVAEKAMELQKAKEKAKKDQETKLIKVLMAGH